MPFTIHMPMPAFRQVDECDDIRNALMTANDLSLSNMQEFILVLDDEKEVINIVYRGIVFEISESKEDY